MTDLTYKIAAYKEIDNFNTDDCVDWALELLSQGIETPNLLILASLSKPTNHFETIPYLVETLNELGIETLKGENAIVSYCYYYINQIRNDCEVKSNLYKVCQFCIDHNYDKKVYDFYLLYWAWNDFDYGESITHYWDNADKNNINTIVIKTASDWIERFFNNIEIKIKE